MRGMVGFWDCGKKKWAFDESDAVTEWKKANKVRNLTEWQAKRFARWYKQTEGKA